MTEKKSSMFETTQKWQKLMPSKQRRRQHLNDSRLTCEHYPLASSLQPAGAGKSKGAHLKLQALLHVSAACSLPSPPSPLLRPKWLETLTSLLRESYVPLALCPKPQPGQPKSWEAPTIRTCTARCCRGFLAIAAAEALKKEQEACSSNKQQR